MARRSKTQITSELAVKIAKKLQAEVENDGGAHDMAVVFHDGAMVASFGIRRGSRKGAGHDHIPRELHVGPAFARGLGQCPKSRQDWIDKLTEDGHIQ
jgi:hypothetical protein